MLKKTTYTIREVARLTGLPDSTLRYYERIGLLHPISRDESSKQRVYTQDDLDHITLIACLSATGMPIADMRAYLTNRAAGGAMAGEQVALLRQRKSQLDAEIDHLQLQSKYVAAKIAYWEAVETGDIAKIAQCSLRTHEIADEMHLPRSSPRRDLTEVKGK